MIITRTPFRITLGGGGTDLPAYYSRYGGFIFAAAIDKYMFLNVNRPIVDDLILTRVDQGTGEAPPAFVVVPNAARASKIRDLLQEHRRPDTRVERHNDEVAILAVQGPESKITLERVFGWSLRGLPQFHAGYFPWTPASEGESVGRLTDDPFPEPLAEHGLVSRTGYTGELGFELFVRLALRLLAGDPRPARPQARARLRGSISRVRGLTYFPRGRVVAEGATLFFSPAAQQSSMQIASWAGANAVAVVPAGEGRIEDGEDVDVLLVGPLL